MSTNQVTLPGLDGSTPLGFLAALGLLRILDEQSSGDGSIRLAWREQGRWNPVVHGVGSGQNAVDAVRRDVEHSNPPSILGFRYVKVGNKRTKVVGGLTPPVAVLRAWLRDQEGPADDGAIAYAYALMCETATQPLDEEARASAEVLEKTGVRADRSGRLDRACMQTPFDFSSRNMQFLEQIGKIRDLIAGSPNWIEPSLLHGQPVGEEIPTMGWDATAKAPGAQYPIRAMTRYPVLEWLAFRGLAFLPVFGSGGKLEATACRGRRLNGKFVWPVWIPPATAPTVGSLLAYRRMTSDEGLGAREMRALGVAQLFCARFAKLGQYDAILTPTEPVGGAVAVPEVLSGAPLRSKTRLRDAPRQSGALAPQGRTAGTTGVRSARANGRA